MTRPARLTVLATSLAAGGLLLSACTGSGSTGTASSSAAATSAAPDVTVSTAATATDTASPAATAATATASPAASKSSAPIATKASEKPVSPSAAAGKGTLVLEPDGLGVATESGSIRHLTFADTDATTIRTVLTNTLGAPTAGDLPECGQGPRKYLQVKGFQVLLDGTKFVGWTDQGAKGRTLTTVAGLGVGSTLKAVKAEIADITVDTASLGPEFVSADGTFGGILDGTKDTSKVTVFYAGETCFFR